MDAAERDPEDERREPEDVLVARFLIGLVIAVLPLLWAPVVWVISGECFHRVDQGARWMGPIPIGLVFLLPLAPVIAVFALSRSAALRGWSVLTLVWAWPLLFFVMGIESWVS